MDQNFPFGGLIGYGNSYFDSVFRFSTVFRLHAKLQDNAGAVQLATGKGLHYCYMIDRVPICCLLGHVTELLFCLYLKIFLPSFFSLIDFWNSMPLIVLDIELTDKNIIKDLGLFNVVLYEVF